MKKRLFYLPVLVLLFAASFYIVRKIKNHIIPQINLQGVIIENLTGGMVNMTSFAGKPLVVNFWGTWCGPCRQELPGFEKVKAKYGDQVNFLFISDEPSAKLIKFRDENNYTLFYAKSQQPFKEMGLTSVPVTYFYNGNGKLTAQTKDPLSEEELNGFIDAIISGK